jgi:hypothetical protein
MAAPHLETPGSDCRIHPSFAIRANNRDLSSCQACSDLTNRLVVRGWAFLNDGVSRSVFSCLLPPAF